MSSTEPATPGAPAAASHASPALPARPGASTCEASPAGSAPASLAGPAPEGSTLAGMSLPDAPPAPGPVLAGPDEDAAAPGDAAAMRAGLGAGAPLLPILLVPDRTLKARARTVRPEDMDEVRALLPSLFATMYAAPGIGLAAPQVGLDLRLAVVDLMPDDQPAPIVLVNPQVVGSSDEQATREEGCLSLPGMYADVTRPARVRVRYQDVEGRTRELEADGLLAACLQHELDHLDGVLFVDHLSALKRNMILRRLAKERKQKAVE